ncbi:Uncharacterized protein APZ42_004448, partial [Daphnia magna]
MLLALTSLSRISEITAVDFRSIILSGQVVKFYLNRLRKSQRKGALQVFSLNSLNPPSLICPVLGLGHYLNVTKNLRATPPSSFILSLKSPHPPVGTSSIGRW